MSPTPATRPARTQPSELQRLFEDLFLPPSEERVLIFQDVPHDDSLPPKERLREQPLYKAPKHVMSLVEPLVETFAVVVLVTAGMLQPQWQGLNFGALVVILSAITMWRWVRNREWGWGALTAGVILGWIVLTSDIDPVGLLPVIGLLFVGRLGLRILRWWKYEVRYVTDRRIIEATGFMGLRVASMPVSSLTDVALTYSAAGEVFGYGHLRVESAGQEQSLSEIPWLMEPEAFHSLITLLAAKANELPTTIQRAVEADRRRQALSQTRPLGQAPPQR